MIAESAPAHPDPMEPHANEPHANEPHEPHEIQPCPHLTKVREQKMIIRNLKNHIKNLNAYTFKVELENISTQVDLPFSRLTLGLSCISTALFAAAILKTSDNAVKNRLAIMLAACQVVPFMECVTFASKYCFKK